jgi:hypothetical protein
MTDAYLRNYVENKRFVSNGKVLGIGCCLALLIIGFASCTRQWSKADVEETQRRGDLVRSALDQYSFKVGSYPEKLEQLLPTYIAQIPAPTVGKGIWDYQRYKGGKDYVLTALPRFSFEPILRTDSRPGWTYDTK